MKAVDVKWKELCFKAATETNPKKFMKAMADLNALLDERREQLAQVKPVISIDHEPIAQWIQ